MAEFIDKFCDDYVDELQQMLTLNLFDKDEVQEIHNKRKQNIALIRKLARTKDDYLQFINFEKDLLLSVKKTRSEKRIQEGKNKLDYKMIERIRKINWEYIKSFISDHDIWVDYFQYFTKFKLNSVTAAIPEYLKLHGSREEAWRNAAEWEMMARRFEEAKICLHKGIQAHPHSGMLFLESIKLELESIDKISEPQISSIKESDKEEPSIWIRRAELTYDLAVKNVTNVAFYIELSKLLEKYPEAHLFRQRVEKDLADKFPGDEDVWEVRARSVLNSNGVAGDLAKGMRCDDRSDVTAAVDVFTQAVRAVPTVKMWDKYLSFLTDVNVVEHPGFKMLLKDGMEAALSENMMSDKHFVTYSRFLEKNGSDYTAEKLLKEGTSRHPHSMALWHERIRFYLRRQKVDGGINVFTEALKIIGDGYVDGCFPLWDLIIIGVGDRNPQALEDLLIRGLKSHKSVCQYVQPRYLAWKVKQDGLEEARKLAFRPEISEKPSLEFLKKLCRLETQQPEPSTKHIRLYHKRICSNFGDNDASHWIEYIKFEATLGDRALIPRIWNEATKKLAPKHQDDFLATHWEKDIQQHLLI